MFQPLESWATVRISGGDRYEFLQGQLTQDLDTIRDGQPKLAGWANPKGRLLCIAWVLDWQNAVHLILPAEQQEFVAQRLGMYVLRSDVEISQPDTAVWFLRQNKPEDSMPIPCFEKDFCLFHTGNSGTLMLGLGQLPEPIRNDTEGHSDINRDWRSACIQAGLPWVYKSTRESFVPQMLNLDLLDAISFDKGCYVGQEIVARTQNLGRIKRRMFGFETVTETGAELVQPGDTVTVGNDTAGIVVDAVNVDGQTRLLAVIRLEHRDAKLSINGSALHPAELPYPLPE